MGAKKQVTRTPRIVADTNVVVSALVFAPSRLAWLRSAWQTGRVKPLLNRDTATELLRVLAYPRFKLTAPEQEELLADFLPYTETIHPPTQPPRLPACRDSFDLPFLLLAQGGRADALVTGDADLLVLNNKFPVPILTPADFKNRFGL